MSLRLAESGTDHGVSHTAFTTANRLVLTPIAKASESTMMMGTPGRRPVCRMADHTSRVRRSTSTP